MGTALQKQKASIYRCNICKLRFARLEDMAFSKDGRMCPYCYKEELFLMQIATAIWTMKLGLDRRSRERE